MREGEIIAFKVVGRPRLSDVHETVQVQSGNIYAGVRYYGEILVPLAPAEIAQAERTLAAVEKWRYTLAILADGHFTPEAATMAKEVLGSC